jgi:Peptidase family S41
MMVCALLSLFLAAAADAQQAFAPEPWLQDFEQLLSEVSSHYANLDSVIADRRVDLVALRKDTEKRIREAASERDAQRAIETFLAAFGDGHASVIWPQPSTPAAPATDGAKSKPLCERLGYATRPAGGIDFTRLRGFTPLDDDDAQRLPGGILEQSGRRRVGILRIGLFSERVHPDLCRTAQLQLGLADDAECKGPCDYRLYVAVGNLLTEAVERRVAALRRAGARALIVDITRNGGGTNWVEPAARVLTPVPLRTPRLGFIRHPHWVTQLKDRLADLELELARDAQPKELLTTAATTLRQMVAEAEKSCDRSGLWSDPPRPPHCSLVVTGTLFSSGILPYAKPGSLDSLEAKNVLFLPSVYRYREGANTLPLYVLVDGGTASASEHFAAMLRDANAATLIGLPTYGAGCGFTNGGIEATLRNSGATLELPDCVRYRRDGTNEVAGIVPDVLVPWSVRDSAYQRAAKLLPLLEKTIKP